MWERLCINPNQPRGKRCALQMAQIMIKMMASGWRSARDATSFEGRNECRSLPLTLRSGSLHGVMVGPHAAKRDADPGRDDRANQREKGVRTEKVRARPHRTSNSGPVAFCECSQQAHQGKRCAPKHHQTTAIWPQFCARFYSARPVGLFLVHVESQSVCFTSGRHQACRKNT